MPPDKMMGILPLTLLGEKDFQRTAHPILSFGGIHADDILLAKPCSIRWHPSAHWRKRMAGSS
jgi:hypothetical protein